MNATNDDLEEIIRCLTLGQIEIVPHAWQRMHERGVFFEDLVNVGKTVSRGKSKFQKNGSFRIAGLDRDGDSLVLICSLEGNAVVITVF